MNPTRSRPATCARTRSGRQQCRAIAGLLLVALVALEAGCASKGPSARAPVEDRLPAARPSASPAIAEPARPAATAPLPGSDNAGKPGFYTVKPGDTLIRIGLDHGQNWRDIARWSGLENPNAIEVGQVLRIAPPQADTVAAARPVAPAGRVESRPLPVAPAAAPQGSSAPAPAQAASAGASGTAAAPPRDPDEGIDWLWPASGAVTSAFDDSRSKGIAIAGKAGDPVLAAADGRVVYAGSGLRGYGNLVIVKHNATYLTAYAHNQQLLVKEDQAVRRGQKIAEMGSSDSDRVQLHFEIRRQGKPIDPQRLLPAR